MSAVFNVQNVARLAFASVTSPMGFPQDGDWAETEPLQSSGVDNTRWRRKRILARPWEVDCIAGFTSWDLAKSEARLYQACSSRIGVLSLTVSTSTYYWTNVHAELIGYEMRTGPIYGSAVTASSTHQLKSMWQFTLTDMSLAP